MGACRHPSDAGSGDRRLFWIAVAVVVGLAVTGIASAATPLLGRRLVDVLESLRQDGLAVVYSTALVSPDLRVTVEPTAADPVERLEQILRPLGLTARRTSAGVLSIVRQDDVPLHGRVVDSEGVPIEDAVIRVGPLSVVSGEDGTFRLGAHRAGSCELRVKARGYRTWTDPDFVLAPDVPPLTVRLTALHTMVTEVVVTPGTRSILLDEPAGTVTITGDDTVLVPTFGGDVSRVIETLPGVAAPDNSSAFNVRGGLADDVSLVLDGMELYEPFHLSAFQSPFSTIDAEVVDRIDFLGGGWTSELGDRHGGFVRLSTEDSLDTRHGELEVGSLNSRFSYGAPLPDVGGGWLVSARTWYPEALGDTIELGETGLAPTFSDTYVKVAGRVGSKSILYGHGLFAVDEIDFVESDGNEAVDSISRSGYMWMRWLFVPTESLTANTVFSVGAVDQSREGLSEPEDDPVLVRDDRDVSLFGVRTDISHDWSGVHLLRGGLDVRRLKADYVYVTGDPANPDPALRLDPKGTSVGAYLSYRARATLALSTEIGLRWDRQSYTDESQVSPRFNAVWRPGERTVLRFGAGFFHQSQRIHELRIEDGETDFLPAERSRHLDLTLQRRLPAGLRLRVDLYDRNLTRVRPRYENFFNPVELFPETESDRLRISPRRARLRGVELLLRGRDERAWRWWVSYTRSSADDDIAGRWVPRSWDQPHAARFLVGYRSDERWSLSLTGSLRSGWPTTPVSAEVVLQGGIPTAEPVLGERNSARFDDYSRLDLKYSRRFDLRRGKLRVDLEVLNLLDRDNLCCVDEASAVLVDPTTARPVRELNYWLGVTPSVSLVWEF